MKIKKRSPNFCSSEVSLLTELVHKRWEILESKKSDTHTWKQKQECWEDVADEFNRLNQESEHRQVAVLKKKWDNIKKHIKHNFIADNNCIKGVECYSPKSTPGYDEFDMKTLSLLNVETQYGFDALSDDHMNDVDVMQDKHPNGSSPNNISSSFPKNSWDNYLPPPFLHQPSVTSIPPLLNDVPATVENNKKEVIKKNCNTAAVRSTRWPNLNEEKLKVVALTKAKLELEIKNMKEKHKFEIEVLKYELEIKKKTLENLTKNICSEKIAHNSDVNMSE